MPWGGLAGAVKRSKLSAIQISSEIPFQSEFARTSSSWGSLPCSGSNASAAATRAESANASARVGDVLDDRATSLASTFCTISQPKGSDPVPRCVTRTAFLCRSAIPLPAAALGSALCRRSCAAQLSCERTISNGYCSGYLPRRQQLRDVQVAAVKVGDLRHLSGIDHP
jgi:hypothetical protein